MELNRPRTGAVTLLVLGGCLCLPLQLHAAPVATQVFQLHPGWNAVYLEVLPEAFDTASVFQGLPVKSVWTWIGSSTKVAYIQDPSEGLRDRTDWLGYFPAGSPEGFLTNLFRVGVNRAYLIDLGGSVEVTWTVTGRPSLRSRSWVPNSYNLVGFGLDPGFSPAPSFAAFFAPAPAHAGQPVYRLDAAGQWQLLTDASQPMRAGEAYWVYSAGNSDYAGPLSVEADAADGLDYGSTLLEKQLRLKSLGNSGSVTVRHLAADELVALLYQKVIQEEDPQNPGSMSTTRRWPALGQELALPAAAGQELFLDLAVQRTGFTADEVESVLSIEDGAGMRRLVPVSASRVQVPADRRRGTAASAHAGLWVGTATIRKVSEVQNAGAVPKTTPAELNLRLIVHVDASGQARLLKDVVQMWEPGGTAAEPNAPGRLVLLTDPARYTDFEGAIPRDGQLIGARYSSAILDFDEQSPSWDDPSDANDPNAPAGPAVKYTLRLDPPGDFGPGGTLACTILLHKNQRTNPFLHKFHPDHDNLDALYVGEAEESFTVRREIELEFATEDPLSTPDPDDPNAPGLSRPGWGSSVMAGTYRETFPALMDNGGTPSDPRDDRLIHGLHKNTIYVEGNFQLGRIEGSAPELNPEVSP